MLYARKMIGGVSPEHFSVDNMRKYFARSPPLSAQDVDGWRPREHVAFLFSEDDEEFHNLIRNHMVMPFVLGDFWSVSVSIEVFHLLYQKLL